MTLSVIERHQHIVDQCEKLDEPIKSDKWMNLLFMKSGRMLRGQKIHPTENHARISMDKDEQGIFEDLDAWYYNSDGKFQGHEYSHYIPVPVKE